MAKVTGRVKITANGKLLASKSNAVISGLGVSGQPNEEKKAVMGDSGIIGYASEIQPARCEVTLVDNDTQMISELAAIFEDGTIVVTTYSGGKVYTMNNATFLGNVGVTSGEGDTPIIFEGSYWTEEKQSKI